MEAGGQRRRWADEEFSDAGSSAGLDGAGLEGAVEEGGAEVGPVAGSLPACSEGSSAGVDVRRCGRWLEDMQARVGKYEGKLLLRHIPGLTAAALNDIMALAESERLVFLLRKRAMATQPGAQAELSKMEMRRVLRDTFAKLARGDPAIQDILAHWDATDDKPTRKSRGSKQWHSEKWFGEGGWRR